MGDSLFNYKARHTQTLFRRVLQFAFCRCWCCCCRRPYPEACFVHCTAQHGTLISNTKIENSIVQFNKFNFRSAKLPNFLMCQPLLTLAFIDFVVCCWLFRENESRWAAWKASKGWITIQHKTPFDSPEDDGRWQRRKITFRVISFVTCDVNAVNNNSEFVALRLSHEKINIERERRKVSCKFATINNFASFAQNYRKHTKAATTERQ